jgi:hypothetical protein
LELALALTHQDLSLAEQQLAKHGFFVSENVQGTPEADELVSILADILKAVQAEAPDAPDAPDSSDSPANALINTPITSQL